MIIDTTLSSYAVRLRCVQNYTGDRAQIYAYSPNKDVELLIAFQREGEQVGTARIDTLPGVYRVITFFPLDMLASIHHLFQTEKPITLYANNNNNYTQVVLGTGTEPIGEEERRGVWPWSI